MADSSSNSACRLLTIPAEIRNQVYQHLFADSLIVLDSLPIYGKDKRGVFCSEKRQCHLSLFRACHKIRDEIRLVFIQSLTVRLQSHRLGESHLPPILQHDGRQHLKMLAFSLMTECYRLPVLDPSYFPNLQNLRLLQHPKARARITRDYGATTISQAILWLELQAKDTSLIERHLMILHSSAPGSGHTATNPNWLHQVYHNPDRRYSVTMEKMVRLILAIDGNPTNNTHRQCHQYCFIYQLDLDKQSQHLHYITKYVTGSKLDLPQCLALCHGR